MKSSSSDHAAVVSAQAHEGAKLKKISEILSRCRHDDPSRPVLQHEIDVGCARLLRLRALGGSETAPANGNGHGNGHETAPLDRAATATLLADVRRRSAGFYRELAAQVQEADISELFRAASAEDGRNPKC